MIKVYICIPHTDLWKVFSHANDLITAQLQALISIVALDASPALCKNDGLFLQQLQSDHCTGITWTKIFDDLEVFIWYLDSLPTDGAPAPIEQPGACPWLNTSQPCLTSTQQRWAARTQ